VVSRSPFTAVPAASQKTISAEKLRSLEEMDYGTRTSANGEAR